MVIVAGDYSLAIYEGTEQEVYPHFLVHHPQYNRTTNNSDIMLIKVQTANYLKESLPELICSQQSKIHSALFP